MGKGEEKGGGEGGRGGRGGRKRRRRAALDYFRRVEEGMGGKEVYGPGEGWKEQFLSSFRELRERMAELQKVCCAIQYNTIFTT